MTPMEELWAKVAQPGADGSKVIKYKSDRDLLYLYANGFVDYRKYPLAQWIHAFEESRQKDGSYLVNRRQWMEKGKYRLNIPVADPFDPQRLQERLFTEAEFKAVFRYFICPSTWVPEASIPKILEYYRKKKKLVDGKIRIDRRIKKELQEILDRIPSPLRMLQLDVARFRKRGRFRVPPTPKTGYVAGMDAQKLAATRLSQLAKSKAAPTKELPGAPGIPLKELKKKRPGRV